ncbi:MAG: PrsW family intramembrane metalloprotease [Bacteroidales bacterium]|nr:PrsW family intramembrane metalloprotease [Bacteroidales bacterium]
MSYYVIRNNQQYGPYTLDALRQYVEAGQLLLHDQACEVNNPSTKQTIKYYLKQNNVKVKIPHNGRLFSQIKDIGRELIFPKDVLKRQHWTSDMKLLLLALIGLVPLLLLSLIGWLSQVAPFVVFYSISLYFSAVWGLFFYFLFKTDQVKLKTSLLIFFLTQAVGFIVFGLGLNFINPFYLIGMDSGFLLRIVFFVFAVGITEEVAKAVPLWIVSARSKEPLIPQTLVFYGLMSGIAFGVFEGVEYQMTVNAEFDYTSSFFLNIARLTSLPFLHAIWCGIAGYFSAFAKLYPKYRKSLYFLAIAIPALLHGIYDSLGGGIIGVLISFIGVVLLMTYLKKGVNYQSKLRK